MGFLFLGLLIVFLLLVSPILAYRAYVRVRELERRSALSELKNVGARLAALERQLGELNRRLEELHAAGGSSARAGSGGNRSAHSAFATPTGSAACYTASCAPAAAKH